MSLNEKVRRKTRACQIKTRRWLTALTGIYDELWEGGAMNEWRGKQWWWGRWRRRRLNIARSSCWQCSMRNISLIRCQIDDAQTLAVVMMPSTSMRVQPSGSLGISHVCLPMSELEFASQTLCHCLLYIFCLLIIKKWNQEHKLV